MNWLRMVRNDDNEHFVACDRSAGDFVLKIGKRRATLTVPLGMPSFGTMAQASILVDAIAARPRVIESAPMGLIEKEWGSEIVLVRHPLYTLKRMVVKPGFQCSIHRHRHKTETFLIEAGRLDLETDARPTAWPDEPMDPMLVAASVGSSMALWDPERVTLTFGEKFDIRRGVAHRFSVPADAQNPARFLEVSTCDDPADNERLVASGPIHSESRVAQVWIPEPLTEGVLERFTSGPWRVDIMLSPDTTELLWELRANAIRVGDLMYFPNMLVLRHRLDCAREGRAFVDQWVKGRGANYIWHEDQRQALQVTMDWLETEADALRVAKDADRAGSADPPNAVEAASKNPILTPSITSALSVVRELERAVEAYPDVESLKVARDSMRRHFDELVERAR